MTEDINKLSDKRLISKLYKESKPYIIVTKNNKNKMMYCRIGRSNAKYPLPAWQGQNTIVINSFYLWLPTYALTKMGFPHFIKHGKGF